MAMITALLLSAAMVGQAGAPAKVSDLDLYKAAAKHAGADPDAHVRLALWCESHGLSTERTKQLTQVILRDPSHALARALLGLVAYDGKWQRPEQISRSIQQNAERADRVSEYFRKRAKTPGRADDQWKLALWCEQNDLKQQATAHLYRVVMIDPSKDAAWKRLGFKKSAGRWAKPEQIAAARAEALAQHKANVHWKATLEKLAESLSSKDRSRRDEALKTLAGVTDPRAVPMVWIVFARGNEPRQKVAVRLLGQIDSPGSSRALALLAVMSPSAQVRGDATASLRQRDPRDFGPLLIGMIGDPIKYQVRPVAGPGSPGVLVIENRDARVNRTYSPPPPPAVTPRPGDYITSDSAGLPVLVRTDTEALNTVRLNQNTLAAAESMFAMTSSSQAANGLGHLGLPPALTQKLAAGMHDQGVPIIDNGGPRNDPAWLTLFVQQQTRIPIGQMMLEAQTVAQAAQQQLARDVQALDACNNSIRQMNACVREVLVDTVGQDLGPQRTAWEKWLVDLFGYSYSPPPDTEKPDYYEDVPLEYQPQAVPVLVAAPQPAAIEIVRHSCFGAGTPVQTINGPRPIESLRFGDQVLSQHAKTGELRYQPLLAVFHNPPNATLRIELPSDSIIATGIHRLWKSGRGWVMARDLKPGDALRTLDGISVVKSVTKEKVQPVFNLRVAEGESFFVGKTGVLAHDNRVVEPTPSPFDAASDILGRSGRAE
jgi:hypothetical protein